MDFLPGSVSRAWARGADEFRVWLFGRKRAFKKVFDLKKDETHIVLKALAEKCHAHDTTMRGNDREQVAAEAMRDVWRFIQHHIEMTDEQYWSLYGGEDK